ncbi:MAG: ribulose-phosphate 3-epimerase [Verrucomicrobia bacterium]|nr:MAG: ribulose-phosphate 3-epimerase [Verrucomicrobiota bacterium]
MQLHLGIKSDPVEYRYSYEWLFRLMEQEQITHLQLGTFFELYQLPDAWFTDLRRKAADHGVTITSMFTAHRELGGFFRDDGPGFEAVARKNFERLIDVASLLGAQSVGSNPGAVLRDRMGTKAQGTATYLRNFRELQRRAGDLGIEWLTIEPMSCLAEPPTLPEEMAAYMQAVLPGGAGVARAGYCMDISHGYANAAKEVIHDPLALLRSALAYTSEIHLKNTDALFNSTFGFGPAELAKGIIDVAVVRDLLLAEAGKIPVEQMIGYLEIGGPKLGRDYSDGDLERNLRESFAHLKEHWLTSPGATSPVADRPIEIKSVSKIWIEPSIMCADAGYLADEVRRLEVLGVHALHIDIMDAHFVPNLPLGLGMIEQIRPLTALPFDAHLMVEDPAFFIPLLAKIGVQYVSVHIETMPHADRVLAMIRDHGMQAGLAFNPATPLDALDYLYPRLDFVLIMTVNPGFAGQALVPTALKKIADCRARLDALGVTIPIQVDGNVSFDNIPAMVAAGGDWLIAGTSSLFSTQASRKDNMARALKAADAGLAQRQQVV